MKAINTAAKGMMNGTMLELKKKARERRKINRKVVDFWFH
jgi:hypothetical protein